MADSYTIVFKSTTSGDSSSGLSSTTISDYVETGAEYISAIAATNKVYNGQAGYGLKFGNSSNPGYVTITLATPVMPTSIVMNASPWGATEGKGLLQDSVYDTTVTGAKGTFADFTYNYDGNTSVTQIIVGTSVKRGYVKSVTVNYGEGGEVVPPTPDPEPVDESIVYNWNTVGTTVLGGNSVEVSTVKIHTNTDAVDAIKFGSSYVYADGKWAAIKPAEGTFKAGDTLKVALCFSNADDTKYAQVDLRAADGNTRIWLSDSASTINGRTSAADPIVQKYVLAADQDSLLFGRYGNTTMFVTSLQVVRPAAVPVAANFCQTEVGHFMAENADPNSFVLLSIGTKNGKTIVRIDQDAAKNSQMFDYLQVTGLATAGEDVAEGGATAMGVEFDTPALVNDSLTLEILWSTVNWPGRWMVQNIRVAAAECEHAVVPVVLASCADVYNKAKNDEVALNDVTVTYVNGKNVWVRDASGSMLLYLSANATWSAGDVLSGVAGVVDIYNGVYEVKPSAAQVTAITVTPGEAPAPIELTAVTTADMNKYIVLKSIAVEGTFAEGTASNITLTLGEGTIVLRNNFKNGYTFEAGKLYDITAVVTLYQNNPQLYFINAEEVEEPIIPADRRINAYGLNVVANGDDYVFSYYSNIAGTAARIIFYDNGQRVAWEEIDAPVAGVNDATIGKDRIPAGTNLTWAVELKANPVTEFGIIAEGENLMKCHLAIDNSPESDYFGRMYVTNRAGSAAGGIYVYNQDYTVHTSNTLAGQPKWQSMGRPSVAADGTVYIGDWGDGHGGVYVMDPATLTATCLFTGSQDANGVWTDNGAALGSSTASVGVYGEGANTVLYAMNEDVSTTGTTLYAHGVNVYQLGQTDGSVLSTWSVAPTMTFALQDNAAQMFVINAISKGAFFSCSRSKGNNASGARSLQFYNTNGERTYVALPEGATEDLTGSLGGGCAVSRDENLLAIVDGDGNILVYSIAWAGDVPSLTLITKYETAMSALGSLCFDYAGNIIVTGGANYNNSTPNKLVAYGVPTDNNVVLVPAKKSLTVSGTATAINDFFEEVVVEKVIRNGQVLIIRDGKTYNMMGQRVR